MPRVRRARSIALLAVPLAIVAASCGGDGETPAPAAAPATTPAPVTPAPAPTSEESKAEESMSEESTAEESKAEESMSEESTAEESAAAESIAEEAMVDLPAYQTLPITDIDGATFTLHEFAGEPVFVEAFATWCPKCREQLGATNEAAAALGDGAVVLALSVETDLAASDVATYAADNGFDNVRFAVMSPELLAALVEQFGNSIANPPSTPKFVIDAAGTAGELITGGESADDIVAVVQAASA